MQNPVHIKLENNEAINLKRNSLLLQESVVKIAQNIQNYKELRKKEYGLKNNIRKDIDSLRKLVFLIEQDLPKNEMSSLSSLNKKILKKELVIKENQENQEFHKEIEFVQKGRKKESNSLQEELQEIREKLARLG